jgi:hypothetical protein
MCSPLEFVGFVFFAAYFCACGFHGFVLYRPGGIAAAMHIVCGKETDPGGVVLLLGTML